MNLEKPLHVKVAEALGWTCIGQDEWNPHLWRGCVPWATGHATGTPTLDPPWPSCVGKWTLAGGYLPLFDTDWAVTGPLIEKYGIRLYEPGYAIGEDRSMWTADIADGPMLRWQSWGRTPLLAVCGLIVSRAGKLKAA